MAMVSQAPALVVLGGTGFVGSALLRRVEKDTDLVARCLVRVTHHPSAAGHITFIPGSLEDLPKDLFPDSPYVVFHLATQQHEPGPLGYVAQNLRNAHCLGQWLTQHCQGVIYTSSLSVLGRRRQEAIDETAPVAPGTELASARAAVERYLLDLGARTGRTVFCVRTRFVLGEGDIRTLPGLHKFMSSGFIPSTGHQRFSIIDVADLAEVLVRLGRRCQERHQSGRPIQTPIHAGYSQPISLHHIRQELRSEVGGIPARTLPIPMCLSRIGIFPSRRLQAAAQQLELFGLDHWTKVDRMESEIGTDITCKDPQAAVRNAARRMVRKRHGAGYGRR